MSESISTNAPGLQVSALPDRSSRPASFPLRVAAIYIPRLLVATMFIYFTGIPKLAEPDKFAKEIRAYNMVPVDVAQAMAIGLPPLEILCGLLLVFGPMRKEARLLILGMLVAFTVAKSAALMQGLDIHCGCVPKESPIAFLFDGLPGIITNCVMIALLVVEGILTPRFIPKKPTI